MKNTVVRMISTSFSYSCGLLDLLQLQVFVLVFIINLKVKYKLETYRSLLYHQYSGVGGG